MYGRIAAFAVAALFACGCTPNGVGVVNGGGANGGGVNHAVAVNLTLNLPVNTQYGQSGGMKPPIVDAKVGDTITFVNTDSFNHTSTSVGNGPKFPSKGPNGTALNQHGVTLSGGWSSGVLAAGATSQKVLADKAGTYLYGCFFHYPAPMRGAIVVH